MKKINGFSRKFHILQFFSYLIFFGNIIIFSVITLPLSIEINQIISAILFYLTSIFVFIYGILATITDPTDEIVKLEKKSRIEKKNFDASLYEYYCNSCDCHVNENSKHCKQCDRCVDNFDHHCKWVNNCIGGKNYKYFFLLIIAVMFNSSIFLAFNYYLTYQYTINQDVLIENSRYLDSENDSLIINMVFLWIFTAISTILFILDSNLVIFHVWLKYNHITTYEYILRRREKFGEKHLNFSQKPEKTEENLAIPKLSPSFSQPKRNSISNDKPPISGLNIKQGKKRGFIEKICCFCISKSNKISISDKPFESETFNLPKVSEYLAENTGCLTEIADTNRKVIHNTLNNINIIPHEENEKMNVLSKYSSIGTSMN